MTEDVLLTNQTVPHEAVEMILLRCPRLLHLPRSDTDACHRVNFSLMDTDEVDWDVTTQGLPQEMRDLSPYARFDNASKGPEIYRPGRSTDRLFKWMPCQYPTPTLENIGNLLKPATEFIRCEVGSSQRGRTCDMNEVKRLLPSMDRQDFDSIEPIPILWNGRWLSSRVRYGR